MAKRKKSTRRKSVRAKRPSTWRRWLWVTLLGCSLAFTLYVFYLDHIVQVRFEGRRWAIPAKVYGRSLPLSAGLRLDQARLLRELEGLGYRRVNHPDRPGSFSNYQGRFLLRTRPFQFAANPRPSDYLEVRLVDGRIATVKQAATGRAIAHYALEPRLIGSLYPAHSEDRVLVRRSELPEGLVRALIAVEDQHFYQHTGVDPLAILRALWVNLRAAGIVQGGSTLTQQLVKNFFLTAERSLWRKFNEVVMALILELRYSKDEILEAYANEIYLGQDGGRAIHGFGLASQFYFNRPLQELDLPKQALLVALVRGPSAYDPRRHPQRAQERRALVLRIMQDQGLISEALMRQAVAAPLGVQRGRTRSSGTPAFMDLIRRQLRRDYREADLNGEGLRIFTTLDPWLQRQAELAVSEQLQHLEESRKLPVRSLQGALVLTDAETGEVLALVGDRNPRYAGFNRALDAVRPIGSLVKPAVYLSALADSGHYHLMSELEDKPVRLKGVDGRIWSPGNYDRVSHGAVSLQTALANSYNQATVQLGLAVGVKRVIRTLQGLGIQRPLEPFPSLLLGAVSLSPLEVSQMYQTLAAGGKLATLQSIREVTDPEGRILSRYPLQVRQSVDPRAVFLLKHGLEQVVRNGTARRLPSLLGGDYRVAGKTGTTDDLRDSWFAGFDQRHVAVAWIGRDDNGSTGLSGATGAMQVWADLLSRIGPVSIGHTPPPGVQQRVVDSTTGLLGEGCPETEMIPFIDGSGPQRSAACGRQRLSGRQGQKTLLDDEINWLQSLFQ
jgi:penicillin-binding protein 1B